MTTRDIRVDLGVALESRALKLGLTREDLGGIVDTRPDLFDGFAEQMRVAKGTLVAPPSTSALTLTTYGRAIKPPFGGARLASDVPYPGPLALGGFELLRVLAPGDPGIRVAEMVELSKEEDGFKGASEFGCRDLDDVWAMRDQISLEQWPVGVYAFAIGTTWQDEDGGQVEYVFRSGVHLWYRYFNWLDFGVSAGDHLLRRK